MRFPFISRAALIACASLLFQNGLLMAASVPYFTDFEEEVGAEWSSLTRSTDHPTTFTAFSGRFGNQSQTLTVDGLTIGEPYTIGFDLYVIDSWDGTGNNDSFEVTVDGVQAFREVFSNYNGNPPSSPQTYPYPPDEGRANFGFVEGYVDAIYRNIEVTFTATAAAATVVFRGINLQDIGDESWGIDNVRVQTESAAAASVILSATLPAEGTVASLAMDRFSITANHNLEAAAATNASNFLLREAGANNTFGDGDDTLITLTPTFTAGKTITFLISQSPLQPGKYRFQADNLQGEDLENVAPFTRLFEIAHPLLGKIESLSNDTLPEAVEIPSTETPDGSRFFTGYALGRFNSTTDVDYYRFQAEAGDKITWRLEADTTGLYPQAYLQNSSGQGINNQGGNWEGIAWGQNFNISTPGTYYLRIHSQYGTGGYAMRLDLSRGVQTDFENNDSISQAQNLVLTIGTGSYSVLVAGALEADDLAGDFFRLGTLNPGNALGVNVAYPIGSVLNGPSTILTLYKESVPVSTNFGAAMNFTIVESGVYYLQAKSAAPALRAQYYLSLSIVDGVAPEVVQVTLPDEGTTTNGTVDRFSITFTEELLASTIADGNSYELRSAGSDGVFDNGDDQLYTVANQNYTSGLTPVFLISDGPLQPGIFRFTLKTSVTDRGGNALANPYTRTFTITPLEGYTRENRTNDTAGTASPLVFTGPVEDKVEVSLAHGNLTSGSDIDYWSFDAEEGQTVMLATETVGHPSASALRFRVLRTGGSQVIDGYADYNGNGQFVSAPLPETGTYYVFVTTYYEYPGEYRFRLSLFDPPVIAEVENNDSIGNANRPYLTLLENTLSAEIYGGALVNDGSGDFFSLGALNFGATINASLREPVNSPLEGSIFIVQQNGTVVASSGVGETTVNYLIPSDAPGNYYVKVTDGTGGGLLNQYFLSLSLADNAAPGILAVSLPSEGSTNTHVSPGFSITFTEDMSPITVNAPGSYELRNAGSDTLFGTGDDETYAVVSTEYSRGVAASFTITDGPLQPGKYRFTITTSVQDKNGNPLSSPYVRNFVVHGVSGYVYENRSNNTRSTATSLSSGSSTGADGTLTVSYTQGGAGANPWGLASGDFNGDSLTDFATANYRGHNVSVFIGNGDSTWSTPTNFPAASGALSIRSGDFNGDSKLDLITANHDSHSVSVLLGVGNGTFQLATNIAAGGSARSVAVADLNGDSRSDIVVGVENTHSVLVLLGLGDGSFEAPIAYPAGGNNLYEVITADLTGDGVLDVITANHASHTISVLPGNGNGTFQVAVTYASGNNPRALAAADFNHDTRLDVAVLNAGNNTVAILMGKADGTLEPAVTYPAESSDPYDLLAVDLIGDGALDLVVASYGRAEITVLNGNSQGAFSPALRYDVPGNPIAFLAGDFDGDLRTDIATANYQGNSISILKGQRAQLLSENPVGSGVRIGSGRGYLANSNDIDFWSFSGKAGDRLEVASENPGSPNSTGLFYDILLPNGQRLTYFYPHHQGWGQASVTLPADGTYYVKVSNWYGYYHEYRFRVTLASTPAIFETENNNSRNEANTIAYSLEGSHQKAVVHGYISIGDWETGDWFALGNLSAGTAIRLNLTQPASSRLAPRIGIYNAANALVHESTVSPTTVEYIVPAGEEGSYALRLVSEGPSRQGDAGPFLTFNGANQYVDTGSWTPGTNWTVQAWVQLSTYVEGRRSIVGGFDACRDWGVAVADGRFALYYRPPGGCSASIVAPEFAELGKWYHLAGTSDGTTARFYINGQLVNTAVVESNYVAADRGVRIGADICCGDYFPGVIDEVSVWEEALDSTAITAGINSILSGNEPGLVGYWQFDEGAGTTISDRSPIGHNGTVVNGAVWSTAGSTAAGGAGIFSQYILDIDLGDTSPPTITALSLPDEGSSSTFVHPYFTIGFSEDMNIASVTDGNNYELRSSGLDRNFGTPDDQLYTIESAGYTAGLSGNFIILDGPLQPGNYRFTVTTRLQDRSGSSLELPFIRTFEVDPLDNYVRESRENNSFIQASMLSPVLSDAPDGSFRVGGGAPRGGNATWDLVSGKYNEDDYLDLITVNSSSDSISVFAGLGDGTFLSPVNFPAGNTPQAIASADLNSDSKLDVVVANYNSHRTTVLLGNGNGTFQAGVEYVTGNNPHAVAIADFNKDGRLDIATANYGHDNVSILLGNGNGTFAAAVNFAAVDGAYDLAVSDLNGDESLDLVIGAGNGQEIAVLIGNGNGTFESPSSYSTGASTPRSVAFGDINSDDKIDLAVMSSSGNKVSVFIGNGDGTFAVAQSFSAGTSDPYQLGLHDINNDSNLDLIIASYGQSRVAVFQGRGDGQFLPKIDYSVPGGPIAFTVDDYNRDGRPDIATANYHEGNVSVVIGRGTQQLVEDPVGTGIRQAMAHGNLDAGDIDYFSFSANAGDRLEIAAEAPGAASQAQLLYEIWEPDGTTRIDYFYTSSSGFGQSAPRNLSNGGTYFVSVKRSHAFAGEYRFRVSLAPAPYVVEAESNNEISSATIIQFSTAIENSTARLLGFINASDASGDYFNLGNLSGGASISITSTNPTTSSLVPHLEIINAAGASLAAADEVLSHTTSGDTADYYLKVTAASGNPGILSQYILSLNIQDDSPPQIVLNTLPAEGSATSGVIDRFTVNFSEEMFAPSVSSSMNFDLRTAGVDGAFGTEDDLVYLLSTSYVRGLTADFSISDGPLQPGSYRFSAYPAVQDRSGNALPLYVRSFSVEPLAGFVLENQQNNTADVATPLAIFESPLGLRTGAGRGNIANTSDLDFWSFQANAASQVTIGGHIPGNPSGSQLHFVLYRPNGSQLTSFTMNNSGSGQSATVTIPENGTYTVRVSYSDHYFSEYNVNVLVSDPVHQMESESNNTINNSTGITLATQGNSQLASVAGYIFNNADLDYLNIGALTNGATVFLATRTPAGSRFAPRVSLYDSAGGYLVEAGSGRAGDGVAEVRITQDGTYYAAVANGDLRSGVDASYVLDVQVVPTGSIAFPNLQVVSTVPPTGSSIVSGSSVNFGFVVRNVGSVATTGAAWSDRVVISRNTILGDSDDVTLGVFPHTGALNPGQEYAFNQSLTLPDGISGDYYLIVHTDFSNAINEFVLEGDNVTTSTATFKINLAPYPDIQVEDLVATVNSSSGFNINWKTANRGTGSVATAFNERLFVKNTRTGNVVTDSERTISTPIAANSSVNQSATITTTEPGIYQILVTTDSDNHFYEFGGDGHVAAELNTFETGYQILADFNITLAANPAAGGTVIGGGIVREGSPVTVRAVPNTTTLPYQFQNWTENGTFQSGESAYTFTANRNRQLVANFNLPSFLVTAGNNPTAGGAVTGAGNYAYGSTATLRANPNFGYKFTNWTQNGSVIGVDPTLSLSVTSNRTVVANYTEAHLAHIVTTATAPAGVANVSGAGTFNNGQSTTITAPAAVTNAETIYAFSRFTLNGSSFATDRSFTKTFSTTDSTNMAFVAEYTSRSQFPLVTNVIGNLNSPVPITTNLVLTFQFNRSMKSTPEPLVTINNPAPGATQPTVLSGGTWITMVNSNDTYRVRPITIAAGMDGTNRVLIAGAQDLEGASLKNTNAYTFVADATLPVISNVQVQRGSGAVVVTWNTDEPASSQVEFGASSSYGRKTPLSIALVTSHRVVVSGLAPETSYNYRVSSQDHAGNLRNSSNATFTTLPAPDLRVTGIALAPQAWQSGSPISITWTNLNSGVGPTSGSWYDQIIVSNRTAGTQLLKEFVFYDAGRLGDIAAGTFKVGQFGLNLPDGPAGAGEIIVSIQADYYNNVLEDNAANTAEANNIATVTRTSTVRSYPDLQVQQLAILPTTLESGANVTVTWRDANTGSAPAAGNIVDRITVRNLTTGELLVNQTLPYDTSASGNNPIAGAQFLPRQYAFSLPNGARGAGQIQIEVTTESNNNIFEFNVGNTGELNNSATIASTSTVAAYPDLAVTAISAPFTAIAGQSISVNWTTLNRGTRATSGSYTDHIFLSSDNAIGNDQHLGTVTFTDVIGVNQSVARMANVTLPQFGTGNRWIVVRTDVGSTIYESDEANNSSIDDVALNLPSNLLLSLSRSSVPENFGLNAVMGTLTRNSGTENALEITLVSSDPSEASVPQTVTIPAGQTSASFPVGIINDELVDGTQNVTISAAAAGMSTVDVNLAVTDEDNAVLRVTVEPHHIREDGGASAAQGLLTRNTDKSQPLTVTLVSSDSRVTVPPSVTIPGGQESVSFPIGAVNNSIPNRSARISITPTAAGYQSYPFVVDFEDDDLPSLTLVFDKDVISEGAANPAVHGTVTRSPVTASPLNVLVHSELESAARVPISITIPPNESSVTFPVSVVNNELVDLPREAMIAVFTADSVFTTAIEEGSAHALLVVTDDDGPTLTVSVDSELLSETGTVIGRVTRNTSTASALTVQLGSEDTTEATVPSSVIIPAGQRTTQFTISGVADNQPDGIQAVTVVASANTFTPGRATLNVSDIDLPDLRVTEITVPNQALTSGNATIAWKVKNDGLSSAEGPWVDRLYLSPTPDGSSLQYLGQFIRSGDLPVGEEYERSGLVSMPANPGRFYIVVQTDSVNAVTEGGERNNSTVSPTALEVEPAYRAFVETDLEQAAAGTPIPLQGRAFKSGSGDPAAFALVSVRINIKGTRRAFDVRADANGNFETTFVPLPNEAGFMTIGADHPGVQQDPVQDELAIHGVRFSEYDLTARMFPMSEFEGEFSIVNIGDLPLTELSIIAEGLPEDIVFEPVYTNALAGLETLPVPYKFIAGNITNELRVRARLKIETAEGAIAYMPLNLTVAPHKATMVANPGVLATGMLRGAQKMVEFNISNVGGAGSGPLEVRVPEVPWLKLITPAQMPSLAPGEIARVVIQLTPPADMPLTKYDGSIVLVSETTSLSVPFSFRALSSAVGDLQVEVTDDYTFHVAGAPKVEDATVTLTDGLSGERIVTGRTDSSGLINFTNLMEGTYQLTVSAPKHGTYRSPVTVTPGILNEVTTFIDRQTVSYRWTVVPTQVEDHYKVVLETVFETEVPVPVVTIDNPLMMPLVVQGMDTQMEIKLTNHGLIAAERVSVVVPQHKDFEIIPLVEVIDILPAKTSMAIPVIVRAKPTAQFASWSQFQQRQALRRQGGQTFTGCDVYPKLQVKWSFVCGPDRRWHVNDASIVPVCVDESCWDKIKDFLEGLAKNPKDIMEWKDQICEIAAILASCVDECLASIVKAACGVATRDVKGAIEGALGFGQCWCPSLPTLPITTGTSNPPPLQTTTWGGGRIGPGGNPDYPVGAPIYWDYSPDCTPGDSVSGGNTTTVLRQSETQEGGVCARVRLRIEQEAVVTRAAFLGTLELENGHTDADLTDVQLILDIRDEQQETAGDRFAIRGPDLTDLTAADGTGIVPRGKTGIAKYTFIPNRLAAPEAPTVYRIGGTLRYREGTNLVEVPLVPDTITVFPDPVLHLVYFQQRDVYSDDPFTDEIEPAEPFALGLLVKNTGKGAAINFRITSAQPEIIENEKGLLIDFKIIGTQVGSESVAPTLTANLGKIDPAQSKVAIWQMVSTLQGKFIDYQATFEHVDALGDQHLSLIESVEIHELIHAVRADRANDDSQPDFLVNDDPDPDNTPDTLYLSDGSVAPVNVASNPVADSPAVLGDLTVQVTASMVSGWSYFKVPNPGAAFRLHRVVRSDGKEIKVGDNAWTTDRSFPAALAGAHREHLFHLLDFNGTGSYTLHYRISDSVVPTLTDLVDVDPVVQATALNSVDVIFSEEIDLATFTAEDISLTRNGSTNLITGTLTISKTGATTYRISGLDAFTGVDGNYQLSVDGAGITDFGDNSVEGFAFVQWVKGSGTAPVIVSVSPVTPALRNIPVASLDVLFSKSLKAGTLDFNDLVLSRDGGPNLITSGVTVTLVSGTTYRVNGLGALSTDSGDYQFTVDASGVQDEASNAGTGQLSVGWTQDTVAPAIVSLEQVTTNPRNIAVPSLEVQFSESVNEGTFDYSDISLTRNGGANLVTSQVKVTKVNATTWRISEFSWVSGNEGTYVLSVNGAGIRDLAGNAGLGTAASMWVMDTTKPGAPSGFAVLPDLGQLATDGITSTQQVMFGGVVLETNLTVRLFDVTANEDLGVATVTDKAFTKSLNLAQGPHRIRTFATDAAGNTSPEAFFEVYVDLAGPTASLAAVTPDPIDSHITSLDVTFSEQINPNTFTRGDLELTRNGGNNLVSALVSIQFVGTNTYRITGLDTLTAEGGLYILSVKMDGIEDVAGNRGKELVTESWRRLGANTPPALVAISDQIVSAETLLVLTNRATDLDIPANVLAFSLGAGAPAGASIDPQTGVFTWNPSRAQGGADYPITVIVTDDGVPPLSDSQEFTVTVSDYAEITIGEGVVRAGDRFSIPVELLASAPVTEFSFDITVKPDYLTNLAVDALILEVGSATIQKLSDTQFHISVEAANGAEFSTLAEVVEIGFTALADRTSAFVPVKISNVTVRKADGVGITRLFTRNGRIVIIDQEPLLEALVDGGVRNMVVYGKPGTRYLIQSTTYLPTIGSAVWTDLDAVTLPTLFEILDIVPAGGQGIYYRAVEQP